MRKHNTVFTRMLWAGLFGSISMTAQAADMAQPALHLAAPVKHRQTAKAPKPAPTASEAVAALLDQTRHDADEIAAIKAKNRVLQEQNKVMQTRIEQAQLVGKLDALNKPKTTVHAADPMLSVSDVSGVGDHLSATLRNGQQSFEVHQGDVTPMGRVVKISASGVLLSQGDRQTLVGLRAGTGESAWTPAFEPAQSMLGTPTSATQIPPPPVGLPSGVRP